jgi:hypothetical protein
LENSYTQGTVKFPKSMTDAYNVLVNWKQNPQNYLRVVDGTSDGMMFVMMAEAEQVTEHSGFAGKCWLCRGMPPEVRHTRVAEWHAIAD